MGTLLQPTKKLYEEDAFLRRFTARVLACEPEGDAWWVVLDRTAFYPEGGGQPADTGRLDEARVTDTRVKEGTIRHRTDAPLTVGEEITGEIDWEPRLDHMEQHTGEHILSGTLHRLFGAENVGFHIGDPAVRMDTDIPLTPAQLAQAEAEANAAVRADAPVRCWYPDSAELAALTYRSKKEIDGPVRLTDAGGADLCACCGTHLRTTGQVGLIKILSAQHYKGGMRLAVVCGQRAQRAVADAWRDAEEAGVLLSAGPGRLREAVTHTADAAEALHRRLAALQQALGEAWAASTRPGETGVFLCPEGDSDTLRRLCLAVTARTGAVCAVLAPGGRGLSYVIHCPGGDARTLAQGLNAAFDGRGGGRGEMCQGSLATDDFDAVRRFLAEQH